MELNPLPDKKRHLIPKPLRHQKNSLCNFQKIPYMNVLKMPVFISMRIVKISILTLYQYSTIISDTQSHDLGFQLFLEYSQWRI